MPRPRPRGREKRDLTLRDLSLLDQIAVLSGRVHHRGWNAHQAFKTEAEFRQLIEDLADEIAARKETYRRERVARGNPLS